MAKNINPLKTGSGAFSKLAFLLIAVAVLMVIINYPSEAAGFALGIWHLLTKIVNGLAAFLRLLGA